LNTNEQHVKFKTSEYLALYSFTLRIQCGVVNMPFYAVMKKKKSPTHHTLAVYNKKVCCLLK